MRTTLRACLLTTVCAVVSLPAVNAEAGLPFFCGRSHCCCRHHGCCEHKKSDDDDGCFGCKAPPRGFAVTSVPAVLTAQQALVVPPLTMRASLMQTERQSLAKEIADVLRKEAAESRKADAEKSRAEAADAPGRMSEEEIERLRRRIDALQQTLSEISKALDEQRGR